MTGVVELQLGRCQRECNSTFTTTFAFYTRPFTLVAVIKCESTFTTTFAFYNTSSLSRFHILYEACCCVTHCCSVC